MIGIVLVTHGQLGREFLAALTQIMGAQAQMHAVSMQLGDDMQQKRNEVEDAIKACDGGQGVALITDLFGGTPSNLAISLMQPGAIEVVAGVNLPMLIKLVQLRQKPLSEAVEEARDAGRRFMNVASQLLQTGS